MDPQNVDPDEDQTPLMGADSETSGDDELEMDDDTEDDDMEEDDLEDDDDAEDDDDDTEGYDILPSNDAGITADDNAAYTEKAEGEHDA